MYSGSRYRPNAVLVLSFGLADDPSFFENVKENCPNVEMADFKFDNSK